MNGFFNSDDTIKLELSERYNSGAMNADGGSLEIVAYNLENGYAYAVSGVKGKLISVDLNGNTDGDKVKENYDRIGHRKFSIDLQLGVQVACGVCLYVKYSPYEFFKSSITSPKFQTISTGISFGF